MEDNRLEAALAAVTEELDDIGRRRNDVFSELGERALPELRDKPAYAGLAAEIAGLEARAGELLARRGELLAEKEALEREEKAKLALRTCFVCKAVNPEGARFCEECGAKLGEPPREYCTACGTMNQPSMKFCGECGARLVEHTPPEEAAEPALIM